MGVSTDAILFYGFPLDENEYDLDWGWSDKYIEALGVSPDTEYKDKLKIIDEKGVEIGFHCSGQFPMPYVYISKSSLQAWRGYPKKVTSLEVQNHWDDSLKAFCKTMGIPYQEPGWYLVSYWG